MIILKKMSVNKLYLFFLLIPFFCFSQKEKEDVYFLLGRKNLEYVIPNNFKKIGIGDILNVYDKKEYEAHQKRVKEAKVNGAYEFDPESGKDNLNMNVFSFEFKVISKKKRKLNSCELNKLNLVDYAWIKENSWKPINREVYKVDFKDLYFIYKIKENEYLFYKVGITVTVN